MSQTFTAIDIPQKPGGFGTSAGGGGKSPGRPSGDKPGRSHQAEKMGPPARKENKKKSSLRRASKTSAKGSGLNEQAGSSSVFLGSSDEDIYPSASQPLRNWPRDFGEDLPVHIDNRQLKRLAQLPTLRPSTLHFKNTLERASNNCDRGSSLGRKWVLEDNSNTTCECYDDVVEHGTSDQRARLDVNMKHLINLLQLCMMSRTRDTKFRGQPKSQLPEHTAD